MCDPHTVLIKVLTKIILHHLTILKINYQGWAIFTWWYIFYSHDNFNIFPQHVNYTLATISLEKS